MLLDINDLKFGYQDNEVLKNISVKFDKPELVGILGPNGVGKSTLVQCLNRILNISGGSIELDGKDVHEYRLKELARYISYVPCSTSEVFPLTVLDTILIGRQPRAGWKHTHRDFEVVQEILELLGIEELALRRFNQLSAGQRQKVVLARGLAQETPIILLDEPTANLDIKHQYSVSKNLKELSRKKNLLILMVCHDLNLASKYCDRVLLLSNGIVFADGTPEKVITKENIRNVYGIECNIFKDGDKPFIVVDDRDL